MNSDKSDDKKVPVEEEEETSTTPDDEYSLGNNRYAWLNEYE